jgi:hypothetical protein
VARHIGCSDAVDKENKRTKEKKFALVINALRCATAQGRDMRYAVCGAAIV